MTTTTTETNPDVVPIPPALARSLRDLKQRHDAELAQAATDLANMLGVPIEGWMFDLDRGAFVRLPTVVDSAHPVSRRDGEERQVSERAAR